ncbi:MAG TPA: hypothetical protein VIK64_11910 [Anaerolineales bacterium]
MDKTLSDLHRIQKGSLTAGIIGLVVLVLGAFLSGLDQFFQSYLYAYLYWLGITLGSLALALLYGMVGGNWGMVIRQISEAASKTLWLVALLFVPVVFGLRYLYPWARPDLVAADPLLQHKSMYLNIPFTVGRAILYFGVWAFLIWSHVRRSSAPPADDPEERRRIQRFSAIGLILYFLTMTFASIDWVMSLQPDWLSSVYGMLIIAGQALSAFAFAIALLPFLVKQEQLAAVITPRHYRDLGALLLTTVMLWAYLGFSQYLIIWYGDLPREVTWYISRTTGGWEWIGLVVILLQFFLPFSILISLRAKQNPRVLAAIASLIIVIRLGDWFWEVAPAFHSQVLRIHWLDIVTPIAIGGLWLAAFFRHLERTPLRLVTASHYSRQSRTEMNEETA